MIWKELITYVRIPKCRCGKCECDIVTQVDSIREEDYLHYFLTGLDRHYAAIRAQLLAQSPLPSVDVAYQQLTMAERLRDGIPKVGNVAAFKVDSRPKQNYEDNSDKFCNHCNQVGHEESGCFQIIGYPEWWGDRGRGGRGRGRGSGGAARGGGRGGSSGTSNSRTPGSSSNASSSKPQQQVRDNKVAGQQQQSKTSSTEDLATGLVGVNASQIQQILEILNPKNKQLHGKIYNIPWIVDTGASNHVTCDINMLTNVKRIQNCPVGLPDGKSTNADQLGTVTLPGGLKLENVLFVPHLTCNLISGTQLSDESNFIMQFTNKICVIQDPQTRKVIGVGEREDGLYVFRGVPQVKVLAVDEDSSFDLWHQRMGHPSESVLKLIPNVSSSSRRKNKVCDICPRAKQSRCSFPISENKASRIFELVHIDLWGSYRTPFSCGAHYFLTIVDDFSRGVWIYLLKNKTDVEFMFLDFVAMVKRQFDHVIKIVRSDNGTEFNSLKDYFRINGMIFETSCVGTPQQNGRVERKHQHILNVARALRFQGNLPIKFWGECVLAACHLINRTPTPLLDNKTPFEILFNKPPSYDYIKVFGCLCYAHIQKTKGDKFVSRSRKCVFLGYPFGKKGWRVLDLETAQIFVSRDVRFFENIFPYDGKSFDDLNTGLRVREMGEVVSEDEFWDELQPRMTTGSEGDVVRVEPAAETTGDGGQPANLQQNSPPHATTQQRCPIQQPVAGQSAAISVGADQPAVGPDETGGIGEGDEECGKGKRTKIANRKYRDL
ncbi:Retrovirus-related Pol polyprotein from transposon RE1 [Bienertia sinuspersici]